MSVKHSATTVDCNYKNIARHTAQPVVSYLTINSGNVSYFWFDDDDDDDDDDDYDGDSNIKYTYSQNHYNRMVSFKHTAHNY